MMIEVDSAINALPEPLSAYRTGIVPLIDQAQKNLTTTQMRTFALAFVVVFVVIGIGFRSIKLMAVVIPPNVVPVMAVFAVMPLAGIQLDVGTVLVAGVAMGISANDTIHFMSTYRRKIRAGDLREGAVQSTLQDIGTALVVTTLTVSAGFAALLSSNFIPLRNYGALSIFAMSIALLADLMLVPAILTFRRRQSKALEIGNRLE
jgi:hypothetical protein